MKIHYVSNALLGEGGTNRHTSLLSISPDTMVREQQKDSKLGLVCQYVAAGNKQNLLKQLEYIQGSTQVSFTIWYSCA